MASLEGLSDKQSKKSIREENNFNLDDALAVEYYCINLFRLSVMWTAACFNNFLLIYMNKGLPGTIFLNFYIDGISQIVAYLIGKPIYKYWKTKASFIIAFAVTLLGSLFMYMLGAEIIDSHFIEALGCPPSPYPYNSESDKDWHLEKIMPVFSFITKVGAHLSMYFSF